MNRDARIWVAGCNSVVGAALVEELHAQGFGNLVGDSKITLTDTSAVESLFATCRPEYVFLAGGMSGGIGLNSAQPATLMLDNLHTIANVIPAAQRHDVHKLLYLASSCAYPRHASQPLLPDSLLTGPLEPTSEAYAMAKIAGWKLCEAYRKQYDCNFITGFPANPFGPGDDFSSEGGHVIPALIRRAHQAKIDAQPALTIWGTGTPRREFSYSRDLARACIFAMDCYEGDAPINLGSGSDLSIADVARAVVEVTGYRGELIFDASKTDGAPFKGLDSRVLRGLGFIPETDFRDAVKQTYEWFLQHEYPEGFSYARTAL